MNLEPQPEHQWLQKLVGEWTCESECYPPNQPPMKSTGTESVRSLGLWTIGEGESQAVEGTWKSIMTLGYDAQKKRFVGTFVANSMPYLWIYDGSLDDAKRKLTLDTEGPDFESGKIIKYQDIIEFVSDDERLLASQIQGEDGAWKPFMKMVYRRKK